MSLQVRDVRWGRAQETYGEDPTLTGDMGAACVRKHTWRPLRQRRDTCARCSGRAERTHALQPGTWHPMYHSGALRTPCHPGPWLVFGRYVTGMQWMGGQASPYGSADSKLAVRNVAKHFVRHRRVPPAPHPPLLPPLAHLACAPHGHAHTGAYAPHTHTHTRVPVRHTRLLSFVFDASQTLSASCGRPRTTPQPAWALASTLYAVLPRRSTVAEAFHCDAPRHAPNDVLTTC